MMSFPPILRRWAAMAVAVPLALALLAPALLLWGRTAAGAAEVPFGEGLLWRIEAPGAPAGAAPNYLFGTMHVTDQRVLTLPEPVRAAFDSAQSATFEVVMDNQVRAKMGQAMVLSDGRTLDKILGPESFAQVVEAGRRYGLGPEQLRFFKPWALATILSIPQAELARAAGGSLPLDQALQARATEQGKPLHALESAQEQIALFNDMPEASQIAMLTSAIEQNATIETMFEEMTVSYLARDTGAIYGRMAAQREAQPELMELFLRRFNDERNRTMAIRMAGRLRQGGAFIAVGALHLPGESGLLSLLTQNGHTVERVY